MKKTIENQWQSKISYEDSPEVHKKVFDYLMENFYQKYDSYLGESIMQSDDPQIYAPEVLAEIADDIIKFEYTDED